MVDQLRSIESETDVMPVCTSAVEETLDGDPIFFSKPWLSDGQKWDKLVVWLVRIDGEPFLPYTNVASRPQVRVKVSGPNTGASEVPGIDEDHFKVLDDECRLTQWDRKRMVAFLRGGAETFTLSVQDAGTGAPLLKETLPIPRAGKPYVEHMATFYGNENATITFRVKVVPFEDTIISGKQIEAFQFSTQIVGTAQKAVLSYPPRPRHRKAVLWFVGRADYFFHPHVGQVFNAAGYDVFVLNYHNNGITRRLRLYTNPYHVRCTSPYDVTMRLCLCSRRRPHAMPGVPRGQRRHGRVSRRDRRLAPLHPQPEEVRRRARLRLFHGRPDHDRLHPLTR